MKSGKSALFMGHLQTTVASFYKLSQFSRWNPRTMHHDAWMDLKDMIPISSYIIFNLAFINHM